MVGVVPAAPAGGRQRTSPAAIVDGGGGPRSQGGGDDGGGAMARAIVVHGISINWRVSGVADCVEGIMSLVIGARWFLDAERRVGKMASSVVVYLDKEAFLGPKAYFRMAAAEYSVVPYRWRE